MRQDMKWAKPFLFGALIATVIMASQFILASADTQTITIPNAADQLQVACNKLAKANGSVELDESQKYACILVRFAPAVTQADYPALKTAVEAVTGIQGINLLVDGRVPTDVGENQQAVLFVSAHMRINDVPVE